MARRKVEWVRVHPEFKKLIGDSDMTGRDFTKMIADKLWAEKIDKKKRQNGGEGFVI